ncbi:MAG TPA: ubiquinol-cytochrome c reductase iron-sulfur subunit [Candidatus Dormibacteraeota bacterium]|nr:ubiquinol-cytochrome c reductase iron-sulfur subunit [Candidatus Dormibacteraeota bacterium]
MSTHSAQGAQEQPETPDEISRRSFMVKAVVTMSGVIGVGLAIPIIGGLIPEAGSGAGSWSPLTHAELSELEAATRKPVKLSFTMTTKDAYLPEQTLEDYVWGIKVDPARFRAARPDIFNGPGGKPDVPYDVANMTFVVFSPLCPHLGCRYAWDASANKFLCPCHGSVYNFDGAHLAGPAPRGLDPLPLREKSGIAQVMWIRYQSTTPDRIVISYQA